MALLPDALKRYNRQLILDGFGEEAQQKLAAAKILLMGAGGLGSPAALYLAAAGVGVLGIVDYDVVDESNLHRQILYSTNDVLKSKAEVAASKLRDQNPLVKINVYTERLTRDNALSIIEQYDIVVDGTDNFAARYLVNDACVLLDKPLVYGSIFKYEGQVTVFNQAMPDGTRSPNYRDVWPTPPAPGEMPSCGETGVLGVLPGVIGTLQATEAIKLATGIGHTLAGRLLMYNALDVSFTEMHYVPNPDNPLTGTKPTQTKLIDYDTFCGTSSLFEISWHELQRKLNQQAVIQLIDVREPIEHSSYNIGGELIPLGTLLQNAHRISRTVPVIMYCKSGQRSNRAVNLLRNEAGFDNVVSLRGGLAGTEVIN